MLFQEHLEKIKNKNSKLVKTKKDLAKKKPDKVTSVKKKHDEVTSVKMNPKPKKSSPSMVIENPKEIEIGQWAVIEFEESTTGCRRFIGKIFKISKGKMYAQFLRPQNTREHDGFVFKYPQVKDVSEISFEQVKKILPAPDTYGRGLLKFCIHVKKL